MSGRQCRRSHPHGPGGARTPPSRRCRRIVRVDFRPTAALEVLCARSGGTGITFLLERGLGWWGNEMRADVRAELARVEGAARPPHPAVGHLLPHGEKAARLDIAAPALLPMGEK